MILGYFDYIVFTILIFLNFRFRNQKIELIKSCLIVLFLFGFLLPISSIIIELERVKLNRGWNDNFEIIYTILRFPTYWLLGLLQLIMLFIILEYKKTVTKKKYEKLISKYYSNLNIDNKQSKTFIKGNFLIFMIRLEIIAEIRIDQIRIIAEYTVPNKGEWFLIICHFDDSFVKIPFNTKNLNKTLTDLNRKLGVTLNLTLFDSSEINSSIIYPTEFNGKQLLNHKGEKFENNYFEISDITKKILTK